MSAERHPRRLMIERAEPWLVNAIWRLVGFVTIAAGGLIGLAAMGALAKLAWRALLIGWNVMP